MSLIDVTKLARQAARRWLQRRPLNTSTEMRITRLCSQRCRQCNVYNRRTQPPSLDLERFRMLAGRLRDYGAHVGLISGGEPLLVPQVEDILKEARETFPVAVTLVTGLYDGIARVQRVAQVALDYDINIQTSLDGLGDLGDDLRGVSDFAATVTDRMRRIARLRARGSARSLLYANVVINNRNIHQVPRLLDLISDCGWLATVGLYHTLTETTRSDGELILRPSSHLEDTLASIMAHPAVLNLKSFVRGIRSAAAKRYPRFCPYLDAPVLSTRTVIMEDGEVYLCRGRSIGNLFRQNLEEIFTGQAYRQRLREYRSCSGCWASCYAERYLLFHPPHFEDLLDTVRKVHRLRTGFRIQSRLSKDGKP
jgi:MoaA/NifB/PqqE/SkfB family radical SAM enzyme